MPIGVDLQRTGAAGTPDAGYDRLSIDPSGNPVLTNDAGVQRPAVTVDGSPIGFLEQVADPSTGPGEIKVYAKDDGGTTKLYKRAPNDGDVSELASGGGGGGGIAYNADGQHTHVTAAGSLPVCAAPAADKVRFVYGLVHVPATAVDPVTVSLNNYLGLATPLALGTLNPGEDTNFIPLVLTAGSGVPELVFSGGGAIDAWASITFVEVDQPSVTVTPINEVPSQILAAPAAGFRRASAGPATSCLFQQIASLVDDFGAGFMTNFDGAPHEVTIYKSPDAGVTLNPVCRFTGFFFEEIPGWPPLAPGETLWAATTVAPTSIQPRMVMFHGDSAVPA